MKLPEEVQKRLGLTQVPLSINTSFVLHCSFYEMNIEGYEQVLITDYDLSNSEKDERMDDMYSVLAKKRINNRILAKTGKVSLELLNDRKIIDRETFIELISEW